MINSICKPQPSSRWRFKALMFQTLFTLAIGFFPCLVLRGQEPPPSRLGPDDVWVVANRLMPASRAVAEHYCGKRKVPLDHIILLDLPDGEEMSRKDYDERLRNPLRQRLASLRGQDFILLTVYGVPIRVSGVGPRPEDAKALELLRQDMKEIATKVTQTEKELARVQAAGNQKEIQLYQSTLRSLKQSQDHQKNQEMRLTGHESQAAVDSELALLWWDNYSLARWIVNSRFFAVPTSLRLSKPPVVLTCRLDGPTPAIAQRLVDDALNAEKAGGPRGMAYVDARGQTWEKASDIVAGSYGGYDQSLRELATLFTSCSIRCKLDNQQELFLPGSCHDCAYYCGWYSVGNYIPALELNTGSIAYHLASGEAVSLREHATKRWVPNLLKDGAAVSIGPVSEPYLIAFPKPATFFAFLMTGQYTLVECYFLSNHLNSWQMMLIGDPLYRPFAAKPRLKTSDIKLSPAGSQFPLR